MKKRVVVDTDAGTDDAVALLLLLTQERKKKFEVVGITCTFGNATIDNVCRNVLITLESINRSDVPVFRGAERALISACDPESTNVEYFHGKDGFGDKILPSPTTNVCSENAVPALNRLAEGGISLICLGPLTNVALALRTYPEFSKNVKEVYIMGGSVTGIGNASPSAEFNFFSDPEAAHIVLSTLVCPISVLPWESCLADNMTVEERFNVDDALPHVGLLNAIERDLYKGKPFWNPCDAFLIAAFLEEDYVARYRKLHLQIDLRDRGRVVVNHQKSPNATIIEKTELRIFKELISKMASYTPTSSDPHS